MPPKKSEFLKKFAELCKAGESVADAAAEAAGVAWDFEEPEMAERLQAECLADDIARLWALRPTRDGITTRRLTHREAEAAADLYNRRRSIAKVAHELRLRSSGEPLSTMYCYPVEFKAWADLLEGKS